MLLSAERVRIFRDSLAHDKRSAPQQRGRNKDLTPWRSTHAPFENNKEGLPIQLNSLGSGTASQPPYTSRFVSNISISQILPTLQLKPPVCRMSEPATRHPFLALVWFRLFFCGHIFGLFALHGQTAVLSYFKCSPNRKTLISPGGCTERFTGRDRKIERQGKANDWFTAEVLWMVL